jgi:hypothetical protein
MTKRKAITDRMKWQSLLYWLEVPCPECGGGIGPDDEIQWDHRAALVHDGAHEYQNIRPVHYDPCHKAKSRRDVQAQAKVKRIAKGGRTRKGQPIKSRGFQKKPEGYKTRWSRT